MSKRKIKTVLTSIVTGFGSVIVAFAFFGAVVVSKVVIEPLYPDGVPQVVRQICVGLLVLLIFYIYSKSGIRKTNKKSGTDDE